MITGKDVIEFILKNKGCKTFRNMNLEQIGFIVKEALEQNLLLCKTNDEGIIIGLLIAQVNHVKKELFILENLSMSLQTLKEFASEGKRRFPNYEVQGMRHDYLRRFNPIRLYNKLKL